MTKLIAVGLAAALGLSGPALAGEIRFTFGEYSGKTTPYWEQVARDFEAEHPDTTIKVEGIPWTNYLQTLTTDISADNAPDISVVASIWIPDFAEQELIDPIEEVASPETLARVIPSLLSPSVVDGTLMGIPFAASARAMMVNDALYEQAGVEPPENWEDFVAAAQKISALGDVYGFGLPGKEEEVDVYYYYILWSFGGEIFKEDGTSGLDTPEALAAAKVYSDMVKAGLTQPSPTGSSREDVFALFKRGKVGTIFTFPMLVPQIADEAPDLEYSVLPFPVKEAKTAMAITDALVLFSSSEVKPEVTTFLDYIYQKQIRSDFDKADGLLPVMQDVLAEDFYQKDPKLAAFANGLNYAKFQPNVGQWDQVADITRNALQSIYTGEATPEEALPAAAQEINALYGL